MNLNVSIQGAEGLSLSIGDHTHIIDTLMKNPSGLFSFEPPNTDRAIIFDDRAVVLAKLRYPLSAELRTKLEAVSAASEPLRRNMARVDATERAIAEKIKQALHSRTSIDGKLWELRRAKETEAVRKLSALSTGLDIAISLLESGRTSIYSSSHSFYRILQLRPEGNISTRQAQKETKDPAPDVADSDIDGAIEGAITGGSAGLVVGIPGGGAGMAAGGIGGALGGGVAGGIISSASKVKDLFDSWWNKVIS